MNTILKIAEQSRNEVELFASRVEDGPDAGCPEGLDCFCAIATDLFVKVSRELGFNLDFVEGFFGDRDPFPNHCWAHYQGKIIDLTATQFGKKEKVYVVNVDNDEYRYTAWNEEAYEALRQWPKDQSPFAYSDEITTMARNVLKTVTV